MHSTATFMPSAEVPLITPADDHAFLFHAHGHGRWRRTFLCRVIFVFDPFPRGLELPGAPAPEFPQLARKFSTVGSEGGFVMRKIFADFLFEGENARTDSATCLANFGLLSTVCHQRFV